MVNLLKVQTAAVEEEKRRLHRSRDQSAVGIHFGDIKAMTVCLNSGRARVLVGFCCYSLVCPSVTSGSRSRKHRAETGTRRAGGRPNCLNIPPQSLRLHH